MAQDNFIEWVGVVTLFLFGITIICQGHFIFHQKHGYSRKETEDPEARDRIRRQVEAVLREIARMIHPHDDEPDPTAYMGNYNFPQMLFAFCVGFATMFVLAIDEINDFKGCPLPEYFQNEVKG